MNAIQLTPPALENTARFSVWRTDYYICTSIAFAKSLGKTVDDFTNFLGDTHDWEEMRGKGLEPPVQLLYFVIKNYPDGEFDILSQSDNSVVMRFNRPYSKFFEAGPVIGTSLDEFEHCLWQHIAIMAGRIELDFSFRIEGNRITATLSTRI